MFCIECGKQVTNDTKFCGECGADQLNSEQPLDQTIAKMNSMANDDFMTKTVNTIWVAVALQVLQVLTDPTSKDISLISVVIIFAINYFVIKNIQSQKNWANIAIYIFTLIFIISFLSKMSSVFYLLIAIAYSAASFFIHKNINNVGIRKNNSLS
jgi:hypothetical protein